MAAASLTTMPKGIHIRNISVLVVQEHRAAFGGLNVTGHRTVVKAIKIVGQPSSARNSEGLRRHSRAEA
jgi:hypothetical protein